MIDTSQITEIKVQGMISKDIIDIDLDVINVLINWYVIHAPKEIRDAPTFLRVMRMHDKLMPLVKREAKCGISAAENILDEQLSKM